MAEADAMLAEQGVRILSESHNKPLFLTLGFHKVHLPLQAPDKYFNLYCPEDIPLPLINEDPLAGVPPEAQLSLRNHQQFTPEKWQQAISA
jgi:hypothetical protein